MDGWGATGSAAGWVPTHRVPTSGMPSWSAPDPSAPASAPLPGSLEVQVTERRGDWAHLICSNTWATWVDARPLEALAPRTAIDPGITVIGPTRAAAAPSGPSDALLMDLGRALDAYQGLVEDLSAGRIDGTTFRRQAFAAGLLLHDGEAWMFDLDRGRWARYDGITIAFGGDLVDTAETPTTTARP